MALRGNINQITTDTPDWICKVQIVDISRERESPEKKVRFQNLIFEDEEEQQIRGVMYSNAISYYADKLKLFHTYLISTAKVKVSSTLYGPPIYKFYWVLDRETIVEHIEPTNESEKPLLPPTKLYITSFDHIAQLTPHTSTEIDILGVVVRCGCPKYAGRASNRCREITVTDNQKRQFLLTLWEDFADIEGAELSAKIEKNEGYPVILGRSIGLSPYQGLSLQTRFNSTIKINPAYPQALDLINWAKTNKGILSAYASGSVSESSASLTSLPIQQQVIPIADIVAQTIIGIFHVEAEISISDDMQKFCVLECSDCKQKLRTKEKRAFDCTNCKRRTTLVPRCTFQIDLTDGSGSTTTVISGDLAENMLSMIAEDIFDTTCAKKQLLPIKHVQHMLSDKIFRVQLRKSSWKGSSMHANLSILSYVEKEHIFQPSIGERNKKKVKPLGSAEIETVGLKLEPSTPSKRK